MPGTLLTNRKISVTIISIIILMLLFMGGAYLGSLKQKQLMDSVNPQLNPSISELGKLIQKGEPPEVLQHHLEVLISNHEQFGDLFIINQDAIILAAKDTNAVGLAYPIMFKSNMFKGLPIPFAYKKSEMPPPSNSYTVMSNPNLMFKVFGSYKTPDNNLYHIIGNYHVSSTINEQLDRFGYYTMLCMRVYHICFILFWLLLAIWVYQDARRRPTNAAAWGILTLFTTVIGWLVYLIARPMLISCPNCNQEQSNDLKFCTSCGALLKSCCTECGGELKGDGEYCGSCGHKMGP